MATRIMTPRRQDEGEFTARCRLAELLILCARIGFNP